MRLAVVETSPHGGLLHYAVQLGDALAERGHSVDLITSRSNELTGHGGPARMRSVLHPPVSSADEAPSAFRYFIRRARIALRLSRSWVRLFSEILRGRYDAVILNLALDVSLSAMASLALTAVPRRPALAKVCHNARPFNRWEGEDLFASSPLLLGLMRRTFPRFDLVLVHGDRSREEFEEVWPPARLAVIPHGDERIFGDEPPPPADEERILFFGDWRKVKGLPTLMDAFDRLAERRPTVRLTIAGTPSQADGDPDAVRRWAKGHGDIVRVIDHYVPIEDVRSVFGDARVVVTPYLVGYQSGVVHLAMTMARAVVASDVGDLGSVVIDGETGRLVHPGDADVLAAALEELVADAELAQRFGDEGRKRLLERSSWETVAEHIEAALATAISNGRR